MELTVPHTQHPTRASLTWHRPLLVLAGTMALLAVASLLGLILDPRELVGAPAWAKPLKFALSIFLYSLTLAWLTGLLTRGRKFAWWTATVAAAALGIEMVVIVGAVVAGTTSHFNVSTPLNATLWGVMALSIVVVWLATLVIGVLLALSRLGDRAVSWAIRSGVVLGLAGMGVAYFMTSPTSEQLEDFRGIAGAHTVGVPDGGPGLFLLGWSTVGGDLRVPHFLGMHALQLLPIAALALAWAARRLPALRPDGVRLGIVVVLSVLYAGMLVVLTLQALAGESVVRPGPVTAAVSAGLFLAAAAVTARILRAGRPSVGRAP
ncbi:hypothetical protein ACX80W_14675 [Arthrobacter sp. TMN-37]